MIINALCDYYDILVKNKDANISPYGFEMTKARYCAVISDTGNLFDIISLNELNEKQAQVFMMPKSMKTSGIAASPVCDNFAYIFGVGGQKGEKTVENKKFKAAKELHIKMFGEARSKEGRAMKNFFDKWEVDKAWENEYIIKHYTNKGNAFSGNIVFRLKGEARYIHECEEIIDIWQKHNEEKQAGKDKYSAQCCVTGEYRQIAKLHSQFQGVKGALPKGASLVCFNKDADCLYNLEQSYNAAVSEIAMFKYSTALKYLLADLKQKMYIGDDTTVFWAKAASSIYVDVFSELFSFYEENKEEGEKEDRETEEIAKTVLKDGMQGIYSCPTIKPNTQFYVLGLAPNSGRLSVRYFYVNTFKEFCQTIKMHYDDIRIFGGGNHKENIKIGSLLYATINANSKDKKVNPLLGGAVMRSILTGGMYPQILFNQTLIRVKTETKVNQARAAIIKGFLKRKSRTQNKKEEINMYLNEESNNTAYVLGRVFAILEKIQKDALGDSINSTIKEKYFASACSNPSLVLPNLLKLAQHHLAKIEGNYWNIQLGNCLALIEGETFPKVQDMGNQGRFILGYYQQNQKNYEKKANIQGGK